MGYVTRSLDLYYDATNNGVADFNGKLRSRTEKAISDYEEQIEELTEAIKVSKEYIKSLKEERKTASSERKDHIDTLIAIEKENINQTKGHIEAIKTLINGEKNRLDNYVEREDLITEGLSGVLNDLSEEDKNLTYSYQLWYERIGEDLPEEEAEEKKASYLNQKLEVQAKKILEMKAAYDKLVETYGSTHEASIAMENQLLAECVIYEKLKDSIAELNDVGGYSQEQVNGIIYNMNDYLKNNYKTLKDAGFSDEVIYAAARGSSGYDKYLESLDTKNKEVPTESDIVTDAEAVVQGLSEKFSGVTTTFASNVESTVSTLVNNVSEILRTTLSQAPQEIKNNVSSVQNNNVTNNYTVNGSGDGFIYSSINALKNFEALRKARGA